MTKNNILSGIPQTLKQLPRWILWRLETRDGAQTKVPYRTDGLRASTTNPSDWTDFDTAVNAFDPEKHSGLGFVLKKEDNIVCIDLDSCILEDGQICDEAKNIVRMMNSWTEISQSGKGLHIFIRGKKPTDKSRAKPREFKAIEVYDNARYIAMTGNHLPGTPLTIEDRQSELNELCASYFPDRESTPPQTVKPHHDLSDDEIIELCFKAKNADKFERLFKIGDTSEYNNDESRAEEGLACMFAFYTKDPAQIERLMNKSALTQREKWIQREKYRRMTIQKAIDYTREHYEPKPNSTTNLDAYPLRKINASVPETDLDDFEEIPTLESYANIDYTFDESLVPDGIFREVYDYIASDVDTPAQFIFTCVLAMFCGIVGTRIYWWSGMLKFKPHDYFTLIANSGGGKTTTLDSVRSILSELEKAFTNNPYQNLFLYPQSSTLRGLLDVMREESEAELHARTVAKEKGKPEPPPKVAQRSGVAIINEVSALFDATKSDFNAGLDATLLELWDGNPKMSATGIRTDGKMRFEDNALTLLSASTPQKFVDRLPKGSFLDGMLPRFQIVNAGRRTQPRKRLTSFRKMQANHTEIVEKLKQFYQFVVGLSEKPVLVSEEAEALDEQSVRMWHEESMNLKDETAENYMDRIDTRKIRYALLFSILECFDQHGRFEDSITMTGTAMQKAIEVCEFYKTHTLHFLVKAKAIKPKAPNEKEPLPVRMKNKLIELGGTADKRKLLRAMNLDEQTFSAALKPLLDTRQVVLTQRKNIKGRNVDVVSIPKKKCRTAMTV